MITSNRPSSPKPKEEGESRVGHPKGIKLRRGRQTVLLVIGSIVVLIGLYYVAGYLLNRQINTDYLGRDCANVLKLENLVGTSYPVEIAPFARTAAFQAKECQDYLAAVDEEKQAAWSPSYSAYQAYLQKYPQGKFMTEARQGAARSLLELVKDHQKGGDYSESIENLMTLLDQFGDTPSSASASEMLPTVYSEWGESLIQERRFSEAINRYGNAIAFSKPEDVPTAQEALAKAYLEWAEDFRHLEDFAGALDMIDRAKNSASDSNTRTQIETARTDTLAAFSRSDGTQAQQVMDKTVKALCLDEKTAQSPIIAMDPNTVRAYPLLTALYGSVNRSDLALSDQVAARTPSSFHYAVCLRGEERHIQSCPYTGGYHIERRQYYWSVKLLDVGTGKVYKQTEINGGTPASCPGTYWFTRGITTETFYGDAPKDGDLDAWLSKVIEKAPPVAPPSGTLTSESKPQAGAAPVIEVVNLRYDSSSGSLVIFQDVAFHDLDGDANKVHYGLVSATANGLQVSDGNIDTSGQQQERGATITGKWACGGNQYEVTIRVTILDRVGNESNAETYTMYCR